MCRIRGDKQAMKNIFFYPTEIGLIGIASEGNAITDLYFPGESIPKDAVVQETELLKEAGRQLQSYLAGELTDFTLPFAPTGTDFQRRVWESLRTIPYGETRSYRELALCTGNTNACRAVGQANHRNPIPIFIPCHRVIGADGKLTGYGGGLEIKTYLLELEKR
jgi:methylated-DNA-[protein]-cysteine S-methyltransferase